MASFPHLLKVSLRQQAIYVPSHEITEDTDNQLDTAVFTVNLAKLGFGVSEKLYQTLAQTSNTFQDKLLASFREITGVHKNWTPLVKGWDTPTQESIQDHITTLFATIFGTKGTSMPCGHLIPENTFPLERYNGCPFCGTPFEFGEIENYGQNNNLKILDLWDLSDIKVFFVDLLTSKTPLDATQIDSLQLLIKELPLPDIQVGMKETLMQIIDTYISNNQEDKTQKLFQTPTDILRYLWYQKTGFLQVIAPKTIAKRKAKNQKHFLKLLDESEFTHHEITQYLKLKYTRKESRTVANWLNDLELSPQKMAEMMHPKREIWVRFIRALRLPEYARKKRFEKLQKLLDIFYHQKYDIWQAELNQHLAEKNTEKALNLLQKRPSIFARYLFSVMLRFGAEKTLFAFQEVIDQIPTRLVFTLNMYAKNYFDKSNSHRAVKPLGGTTKQIPKHSLLTHYSTKQLREMQSGIEDLCLFVMKKRFHSPENQHKTIFIDPLLFYMPVPIGDRSETIQDLPSALMGTRFSTEGTTIRLFMQWGEGLPAQHLDMDLSCVVIYENQKQICYYGILTIPACKHSGDIRSIPKEVGTAEYIDIDLEKLREKRAKYVVFTCNAYSNGELSPNLVVGWMNSQFPMQISEQSGVAYDPACVQHQIRISQSLTKGLVFGILEMKTEEIIWLEMPFEGQNVHNLNIDTVTLLLDKLNNKLSIGHLLKIKAEAQSLEQIDTPDADENYTQEWAKNTAKVSQLLID